MRFVIVLLLLLALFAGVGGGVARTDSNWMSTPHGPGPCVTTREDIISLVGYYNDEVWGPHFGASAARMAYVKTAIYATGDRESGNNQCRPNGQYVVGDWYADGRRGHSISFVQLHDGYNDAGYYIGSAWHNAENPYRHLGLNARYDAEIAAAFITWYAYRYGNLGPWCTPHAQSWMCGR